MKNFIPIISAADYVSAHTHDPSAIEQIFMFVLTLMASAVIYCVPVVIYRFAIRKDKFEFKWKTILIAWVFWVCSFIAMFLFYLIIGLYDDGDFSVRPGIPDFLCLFINVMILCLGESVPPIPKNAPPRPSSPYVPNPSVPSKPSPDSSEKCTKCGSLLSPNGAFCSMCGQKVAPPIPPGMTVCIKCGQTVKQGKFCSECGQPIPIDYIRQSRNSGPKSVRTDSFGNIINPNQK